MKKTIFLPLFFFSVLVSGCCSTKSDPFKTTDKATLYDSSWELEYISGPRIAFEGLYPDAKPGITFTVADNQFSGDNSCNIFSGKYTLKNNIIHFGDTMKTMRFCEGGGEETFMSMLGKVNRFSFDSEGKLLLLVDDVPMMRFKKITKSN